MFCFVLLFSFSPSPLSPLPPSLSLSLSLSPLSPLSPFPEIRDFLEAAGFGNEEEMQSSLDAGVDVNSVESRSGDTALHQATWGNHHEAVKFLLKNDADPNIKNLAGYTPLLLATRKEGEGSLAIMKNVANARRCGAMGYKQQPVTQHSTGQHILEEKM